MDLQNTFFWYSLLELGKLHFDFKKKARKWKLLKEKSAGNLSEDPCKAGEVFYSVLYKIIGSLMYSMRVAESCSRWWCAKDKNVMQYTATLNSLPHREVMLLSSINFFYLFYLFYFKWSLFRLQEAEAAAGSCRRIALGRGRGLKRGYISLFPSGLLFFPLRREREEEICKLKKQFSIKKTSFG